MSPPPTAVPPTLGASEDAPPDSVRPPAEESRSGAAQNVRPGRSAAPGELSRQAGGVDPDLDGGQAVAVHVGLVTHDTRVYRPALCRPALC